MARRVMAVLGGLCLAATLAACGATNDAAQPSRTVPPGSVPTSLAPPTTVPVNYACTPADAPLTIEAGKPTVEVPEGEAPTELVTTDLTVGDGPVAEAGDKVQMQYVGVSYSNGEEFDASWTRNEPFEVTLGEGMVIPGWDQGIPGMALGGRRQLVIPPDLAYGEAGQGDIGPNETLVFVVDLVQVCKPEAPATTSSVVDPATGGDPSTETTVAPDSSTTTTTTTSESTTTTAAAESTTTTAAG